MADQKITDFAALTGANAATGDLVEVIDVSDTSMHATGTNVKMTIQALATAVAGLLADPTDFVLGSTTGTKIGTATTQKLGFYNVTPVVQPAGTTDVAASLVTLGLRAASSNPPLNLGTGAVTCGALTATGNCNLGDATADLVGFHGATATDQCAAYTQTYSTADRTHANHTATAHTYPASGNLFDAVANDLLINVRTDTVANAVADIVINEKSLADNLNQLLADVTDVKQLVNAVIDDLQEKGLVG